MLPPDVLPARQVAVQTRWGTPPEPRQIGGAGEAGLRVDDQYLVNVDADCAVPGD